VPVDKTDMKTEKSIEILYNTIKPRLGTRQARETVMAVVGCILDDLETENLAVTEDEISRRIFRIKEEFVRTAKAQVS